MTPLSYRLRLLCALGAGATSVLAYAPFDAFWFAPFAWGALPWLLRASPSSRAAAGVGYAWGLGAFFAGIGWLIVALHVYGNMPLPLAVVAILLFAGYLALYPALAAALFQRLRRGRPLSDALLLAACWTLGEWLRGTVLTGFPWLALGYTQTPPSPLAGFAPVLGVYGVGALLVFAVAWPALGGGRRALGAAGVLLALGLGLRQIAWTAPQGTPLTVALLQTNIPQDQKWDTELLLQWLRLNHEMLAANPARLVVLPETTLPLLAEHLPQGYLEAMEASARAAGGDVVIGVFTREAGAVQNSAITRGVSPPQRYSKNHLVPFGEFRPPLFGWFYQLADIPMADQRPGGAQQAPLAIADQQIAVNICYEDVFGEELLSALPQATLMLNLSNLAWYGDSHAQPQHLQIARMRALETGRPMLRATNTGMTAVVQPDGAVREVLPAFTRGAIRAEVRGYTGLTPYARWGNAPVLLGVALVLVGCALARRAARV